MGTVFQYLALPQEQDLVVAWFRALLPAPREVPKEHGMLLYFDSLGPLVGDPLECTQVTARFYSCTATAPRRSPDGGRNSFPPNAAPAAIPGARSGQPSPQRLAELF